MYLVHEHVCIAPPRSLSVRAAAAVRRADRRLRLRKCARASALASQVRSRATRAHFGLWRPLGRPRSSAAAVGTATDEPRPRHVALGHSALPHTATGAAAARLISKPPKLERERWYSRRVAAEFVGTAKSAGTERRAQTVVAAGCLQKVNSGSASC